MLLLGSFTSDVTEDVCFLFRIYSETTDSVWWNHSLYFEAISHLCFAFYCEQNQVKLVLNVSGTSSTQSAILCIPFNCVLLVKGADVEWCS